MELSGYAAHELSALVARVSGLTVPRLALPSAWTGTSTTPPLGRWTRSAAPGVGIPAPETQGVADEGACALTQT